MSAFSDDPVEQLHQQQQLEDAERERRFDHAPAAPGCRVTQEAVVERELEGEPGCPICGRGAEDHLSEWPW